MNLINFNKMGCLNSKQEVTKAVKAPMSANQQINSVSPNNGWDSDPDTPQKQSQKKIEVVQSANKKVISQPSA